MNSDIDLLEEFEEDVLEDEEVDVRDVIEILGNGCFQLYILNYCSILCALEYMDIMLIVLLLPNIREKWNLSPVDEAILAASVLFGNFFGSLLCGYLTDRYGRKNTILIAIFSTIISSCLSMILSNFYIFTFIRFLVGICSGAELVAHTMVLEYLPVKRRGFWLGIFSFSWAFGCLYISICGWIVFPLFVPEVSWRVFIFLSFLPGILTLPLLYYIPESIRYLSILKSTEDRDHNERQIKSIVRQMERWNCKTLPFEEDYKIKFTLPSQYKRGIIGEMISKPKLIPIVLNLIFFCGCAIFVYNAICLMTPNLFNDASTSVRDPSNLMYPGTVFNTLIEIPAVAVLSLSIIFLSRKAVQIIGFLGICFGVLFLAFPIYNKVYLFIFTFIARWSAVWTYDIVLIFATESLPTNIRGRGFGTASAVAHVLSIPCPFIAISVGLNHPHIAMIVLLICSILGIFSTFIHPKETKGEQTEDVHINVTKKYLLGNKKDDESTIALVTNIQ